jgi:hypothetical protein
MKNGVFWDVTPEELSASNLRVTRISELGANANYTLYLLLVHRFLSP